MIRNRLIIAAVAATFSAAIASAEDFEVPPAEAPTVSLPADHVAGPDFHVRDPVLGDGLMRQYVVESRLGTFAAYGRESLNIRIQEIQALTQISKTSDVEVVARSAVRGVGKELKTAYDVARHPIGTLVGIPKGIAHLFKGYSAQAKELTAKVKSAAAPAPDQGAVSGAKIVSDARRYADQYLGVSAAERRWFGHFGVDPYTNNEALRKAVARIAKIDATTSLGMKLAALPAIPFAGEMQKVMDAIYNEDPAVLRARRRDTLLSYGLTPAEIERFDNTLLLSPTDQHRIEEAARRLTGVDGRAELFRHAMSVTSPDEAAVFERSLEMLAQAHQTRPVARIASGLRLPTAQLTDHRVIVFGAFDAVYWTQDVAGYERALHMALPADAAAVELWTSGKVSERARAELKLRGWEVHEIGG